MPLYEVTQTNNATVQYTYRVEAATEDEAIAKARTGEHPCIDQEVSNEEETDVEAWLINEGGGRG